MEATGVLVLRVWRDGDAPGQVRARVTSRLDVADEPESSEAFASAIADHGEAVCEAVRRFLTAFAERTRRGDPPLGAT